MTKEFNPYLLIAFMLIGIVAGLVYYNVINHIVGGVFLISIGILFYIFELGKIKAVEK